MNTFDRIIYRQEDTALMIINSDPTIPTVTRFVNELPEEQKAKFIILGEYCASLVEPPLFDYLCYFADVERLDVQPLEGLVVSVFRSDMSVDDKKKLDDVLAICTALIN